MRIIYKRQHYLSVIRWGAVAVVQVLNESVKLLALLQIVGGDKLIIPFC
ncbi:Uncharacterised protein [Salmonella enterica subsp. enterica serovar Typhimurium str. DT104]|nr:Uncharacterised protein [Salmonella enterica subsp. enterica serovar Typhimurium str. DT104]CNP30885.1 Uncharacterised protein [Salmonella enterica subsp. enterica serovar Typhimurium str. DT104]